MATIILARLARHGVPRQQRLIYIKDPIPLSWIQRAAAISGKALQVAGGLWFVKRLCCRATFPFKRKLTADLRVSGNVRRADQDGRGGPHPSRTASRPVARGNDSRALKLNRSTQHKVPRSITQFEAL